MHTDHLDQILDEFTRKAYKPTNEEVLEAEIKRVDSKVDSVKSEIDIRIDSVETDLNEKVEKAIEIAKENKKQKGEKGEDGKDYILTSADKKEIAKSITVPVVERIFERVETIKERPIVTENKIEIIKEVALHDTGESIVEKINSLDTDEEHQIDAKHIKNLPKGNTIIGGGLSRGVADSLYAPIGSTGFGGTQEKSTTIPNGVLMTFSFTNTPKMIFWNGLLQTLTDDYTVSGSSITFEASAGTPLTGDKIINVY